MLKKFFRPLRELLIKFERFQRALADYRKRLKAERDRQRWTNLMSAGYTVRKNDKPFKLDVTPTDEEVIVGYADGRMIGQRPVTPTIIRPFGLGRGKWK